MSFALPGLLEEPDVRRSQKEGQSRDTKKGAGLGTAGRKTSREKRVRFPVEVATAKSDSGNFEGNPPRRSSNVQRAYQALLDPFHRAATHGDLYTVQVGKSPILKFTEVFAPPRREVGRPIGGIVPHKQGPRPRAPSPPLEPSHESLFMSLCWYQEKEDRMPPGGDVGLREEALRAEEVDGVLEEEQGELLPPHCLVEWETDIVWDGDDAGKDLPPRRKRARVTPGAGDMRELDG
eukprot:CAMPEP_0119152412 /NCGR_PEP_ID=MMETSP1310-20130426/47764_1 /TAXON_ID=464262 /ORGANISM="Genus nov. species nov., Strain RCC2339" /LENGTH=234 /DNA_ID=CAMNT_0007144769 /DNA_START=70 /DNA_END=770 /DNA_ORIENTATION=+